MPDLLQFVDSISASPTVRLNLNDDATWSVQYDGTDFSPPPLRQAWASTLLADGETLAAAAYANRTIRLRLDLQTASIDASWTQLQALHRELNRERNLLKWQPQGTTSPVFFRTIRSMANRVTEYPGAGLLRTVDVEVEAEPFALGLKESLGTVTVFNDPATPGPDLNANPYFESTATPWTAIGGTVARSTAQFHQGAASLLFTPDGVTASVEARSETVPASVGQVIRGSAWVRCAVARVVSVGIIWRDAGATLLSTAFSTASVAANTWQLIEVSSTAPANTAFAQITVGMGSTPPASNTLHIDEARLRLEGAGGGMYADLTGVKGDVETPLRITIPQSGGLVAAGQMSLLAMRRRGTPSQVPFCLQAEAMTQGTDTTTQSAADDASGTGSKWSRTAFTSTAPLARLTVQTFPGTPLEDVRGRYRVFARVRTTVATDAVYARLRWGWSLLSAGNDEVSIGFDGSSGYDGWKLVDLGLIQFPAGAEPGKDSMSDASMPAYGQMVAVEARRQTGTGSLDWDYLVFVPADDRLQIVKWGDVAWVGGSVVIDGASATVYPLSSAGFVFGGSPPSAVAGGFMMVSPGVTNRLYWLRSVGLLASDVLGSVSTSLTVEYQPRYLYARPVSS